MIEENLGTNFIRTFQLFKAKNKVQSNTFVQKVQLNIDGRTSTCITNPKTEKHNRKKEKKQKHSWFTSIFLLVRYMRCGGGASACRGFTEKYTS